MEDLTTKKIIAKANEVIIGKKFTNLVRHKEIGRIRLIFASMEFNILISIINNNNVYVYVNKDESFYKLN